MTCPLSWHQCLTPGLPRQGIAPVRLRRRRRGGPDVTSTDCRDLYINQATAEGIAKVAKEWLSASNASAIVIRPEAPAKEGK